MKTKTSLAAILALGSLSAAAAHAGDRGWQTHANIVVCADYFHMKDGEAAADRGDRAWLNETGCMIVGTPIGVTILQEPPLISTQVWRVRLHFKDASDATAYMRGYNVMGWSEAGVGPLPYDDVFRENARIYAQTAKPSAGTVNEAHEFDRLLKNLQQRPNPPTSRPSAEMDRVADRVGEQLARCWNINASARDAKVAVEIRAVVQPDGTVSEATIVDQARLGDPLWRAAAEAARRSFFNPACTPLKVPAGIHELTVTMRAPN